MATGKNDASMDIIKGAAKENANPISSNHVGVSIPQPIPRRRHLRCESSDSESLATETQQMRVTSPSTPPSLGIQASSVTTQTSPSSASGDQPSGVPRKIQCISGSSQRPEGRSPQRHPLLPLARSPASPPNAPRYFPNTPAPQDRNVGFVVVPASVGVDYFTNQPLQNGLLAPHAALAPAVPPKAKTPSPEQSPRTFFKPPATIAGRQSCDETLVAAVEVAPSREPSA